MSLIAKPTQYAFSLSFALITHMEYNRIAPSNLLCWPRMHKWGRGFKPRVRGGTLVTPPEVQTAHCWRRPWPRLSLTQQEQPLHVEGHSTLEGGAQLFAARV